MHFALIHTVCSIQAKLLELRSKIEENNEVRLGTTSFSVTTKVYLSVQRLKRDFSSSYLKIDVIGGYE
jgi:hypothetical protein